VCVCREELPVLILYAMIPDHVRRNYLRKSWVGHVMHGRPIGGDSDRMLRGHPHFEVIDGRLVSRGLITDILYAIEDSEALRYAEAAVTESFLVEMHAVSFAKNVPFAVIVLPENHPYEHAPALAA
jgi:hypothetical protein